MTRTPTTSVAFRVLVTSLGFSLLVAAPFAAQDQRARTTRVPYADAQPLFQLLRHELLPENLRDLGPAERERRWPDWVMRRDVEIRFRLARGNEDSLVNLLLFGTAFTGQPRVRYAAIPNLLDDADATQVVRRRIDDLIAAVASPGTNERLRFARALMTDQGLDPGTAVGRRRAAEYLLAITTRAVEDRRRYDAADASAKRLEDPNASLIGRGTQYRDRGLSSDTSLFPDHALEEALEGLKAEQLLEAGAVRRVAVIGPGLDFVDKQDGYDFYPVQTLQPFAVLDSLLRLGLASATDLRTTTFEVNPRIAQHLDAARLRARASEGYAVWLPRATDEAWTPALVQFWERFGDRIGEEERLLALPTIPGNVRVRVVRLRPDVILRTTPQDLNIVLERLDLSVEERFDLIIATNTLVYYDVFEQLLSLANVARMLRAGGIFLSNNFVVPNEAMPLAGYTDVPYTAFGDGDRIFWYRRQ